MSSCSSADHRLLRCRCSLNPEIVRMSSERQIQPHERSVFAAAEAKWGRREEWLRERERPRVTNFIRATTDHPRKERKKKAKALPRVVNIAIKPNLGFVLLGLLRWQLSRALSINQSIKQSINQFTPQRLKWMDTNKKQCYLHGRTPQWPSH